MSNELKEMEVNKERDLAKEFVLNTNRNIFLTGKAGTGKTTLLKEILEETDKNYLVTAPTGVAAINAGGITLHSLFLFPLKTFLPIKYSNHPEDTYCDQAQLVKHQKFNRQKLDLILELELLVIDEISMVRADVFDAIDYTLRRVRRNPAPFGGVQLLVIGDLFQLSPVVRHNVERVLSEFYKSPFFFDSQVWSQSETINIELKKVYRQEEQDFVDMLNSIRVGARDQSIVERLNSNFNDDPDYGGVITLTTHNRKADAINEGELSKLEANEVELAAKITGRFPNSAFPTLENIVIKKYAQVMFVRNHPEDLYFNGKIGKITKIDETTVTVKTTDGKSIIVDQVEWKNTKYVVNEESGKIEQEEVGSFTQYPLRLAWAVTVHKSQGLTFDLVILDLEGSFAAGQLYVALSRCRSLDGLSLSSKIKIENIIVDQRVLKFTKANNQSDNLQAVLEHEKLIYGQFKLKKSFQLGKISANLDLWKEVIIEREIPGQADCLVLVNNMIEEFYKLARVADTFSIKIDQLIDDPAVDHAHIEERSSKAIEYFTNEIHEKILKAIFLHGAEYSVKTGVGAYMREVENVEYSIWKIVERLYKIKYRDELIFKGEQKHVRKSAPRKQIKKAPKGETYKITYGMFKEGKALALIAKERGLTIGTIEAHISKLIQEEKVSIFDVMKEKRVEKALKVANAYVDLNFTELIQRMPFKMSFGELRWVTAHRDLIGEKGED